MLVIGTAVVVLIAIVVTLRRGLTRVRASVTVIAFGLALPALAFTVPLAEAAAVVSVPLATASGFSVLAATTVTNTGGSVLAGSVGVSPGNAVTGFPPGLVTPPAIIDTSATATQAQADLTSAYNDAAGRSVTATTTADLAGLNLTAGVYSGPDKSPLGLTGTLTLDAENDPAAVFIFQTDSTLITGTASTVSLINGAQACNVFWQVGSSATLGTNSVFVGNVLALTSVSVTSGVTVHGRALARTGAVTLDDDTFTDASCAQTSGTTTTGAGSSSTTTDTGSSSTTTQESGSTTTTTTDTGSSSTTTQGSSTTDNSTYLGSSTTTSTTGLVTQSQPSGPSTTTGTGLTGGTLPSGGPGTPGITTQDLAQTGYPATPLVLLGGLMVAIGLATLLVGRDRNVQH